MTDRELIQGLKRLKVETGSLACSGCGREHSCGIHGCAILRKAADRLEALLAENERLKAGKDMNVPTEWVSVEERLPEYVGDYLVVLDGTREMAVLFFDKWPPSWTDDDDTEYKVTHWMPTPCRPEEVE